MNALFLFAWLATKRPLMPDAPILPTHYLLYVSPFIAASPLSVLGYGRIVRTGCERHVAPLLWLAAVIGLEGYAIFESPRAGLGLTLAYRGVNFLLPPLAVLCAIGLYQLHGAGGIGWRRLANAGAVVLAFTILAMNIYGVYGVASLQERYMGYFWLYRAPEYRAGLWIATACDNQMIAGDANVSHLLRYYFGLKVDELQGLLYLTGRSGFESQILFTYDQMLKNGYVIYGGCSVDLLKDWMKKTSTNLNLIYSNGLVGVYASE